MNYGQQDQFKAGVNGSALAGYSLFRAVEHQFPVPNLRTSVAIQFRVRLYFQVTSCPFDIAQSSAELATLIRLLPMYQVLKTNLRRINCNRLRENT